MIIFSPGGGRSLPTLLGTKYDATRAKRGLPCPIHFPTLPSSQIMSIEKLWHDEKGSCPPAGSQDRISFFDYVLPVRLSQYTGNVGTLTDPYRGGGGLTTRPFAPHHISLTSISPAGAVRQRLRRLVQWSRSPRKRGCWYRGATVCPILGTPPTTWPWREHSASGRDAPCFEPTTAKHNNASSRWI